MNFFSKKAIITALVLSVVGAAFLGPVAYKNKGNLFQNEWFQLAVPLFHSVRKLPDAPFILAASFYKSKLDTYDLFISNTNIGKMNKALPDAPFRSSLGEENKVWVNADFRAQDYNDGIDVRYRGDLGMHWNSYQKSYAIKFPRRNLFDGMRRLSMIIARDRKYFASSLNNYRGRKMGLNVPDEYYVNLTMNGAKMGVYLSQEGWSQEWIEKKPISPLSKLFGGPDPVDTLRRGDEDFFAYDPSSVLYWKNLSVDSEESQPELVMLLHFLEAASDEEFKGLAPVILDLESFYAQDAINVLTGTYHMYEDGNNIILLFDATEGRFKPVPYNASLVTKESHLYFGKQALRAPNLQRRIWSIPEFRQERDAYFAQYVAENSKDDIAFMDTWITDMKWEFFKDTAKLVNNVMFLKDLKRFREAVTEHISELTPTVLNDYDSFVPSNEPLIFTGEFDRLTDTSIDVHSFLTLNRQFSLKNEDELHLSAGNHYFNKTVIIPQGTKLTVAPGANLIMAKEVSLISYSPIHADGKASSKINVQPLRESEPWGVLAIINAEEEESVFRYVTLRGGSETRMNGVRFSGMLALHNTKSVIVNSEFVDVRGEDALNVQGGTTIISRNVFEHVVSDALDTDFVDADSKVDGNTFIDTGGDAMDISWGDFVLENNIVIGCADKGISIGERSRPTLRGNIIADCDMGIAVKDQSNAVIEKNILLRNRIGVALYKKKDVFGGGIASIVGNTMWENGKEISSDAVSHYEEVGTLRSEPDLKNLSPELVNLIHLY